MLHMDCELNFNLSQKWDFLYTYDTNFYNLPPCYVVTNLLM